jgi:hypothetical protein
MGEAQSHDHDRDRYRRDPLGGLLRLVLLRDRPEPEGRLVSVAALELAPAATESI